MYENYEIDELTAIVRAWGFILEAIAFTTAQTGKEPSGDDFLWSGLIIKENLNAVSQAMEKAIEGRSC